MDPELRIKALALISETHRNAFDERRSYEWKVVTAAITIDVLAVAARYAGKLSFDSNAVAIVAVAILSSLLALVSIGYIRHMHEKNDMNKKMYHAAENELIEYIASQQLTTALVEVKMPLIKTQTGQGTGSSLLLLYSLLPQYAYLSRSN